MKKNKVSLTMEQIKGTHQFDIKDWSVDWSFGEYLTHKMSVTLNL